MSWPLAPLTITLERFFSTPYIPWRYRLGWRVSRLYRAHGAGVAVRRGLGGMCSRGSSCCLFVGFKFGRPTCRFQIRLLLWWLVEWSLICRSVFKPVLALPIWTVINQCERQLDWMISVYSKHRWYLISADFQAQIHMGDTRIYLLFPEITVLVTGLPRRV